MAQPNFNLYNPAQFIVEYYTTYVYKRSNIHSFYEKSAMIYRPGFPNNLSLPVYGCADQLFFSKEGDHITVLNYSILPLQYGYLFIINGKIDSDGRTAYFNQVLQIQFFGYSRLIVADYCSFTGPPLTVFSLSEYFDIYDPNLQSNEVAYTSDIPKQDEKNNQTEQPKPQVPQNQQKPQQPQQNHNDYSNNGGRGKDGYRNYNNQRGRGRGQTRNDRERDLSDRYGSSNKYTFNATQSSQSSQKYVPPTSQMNQNNK